MHPFPETPPLEENADFRGHLWIQELPTGGRFRFSVADSGLVTFGTADETFAGVDAVPPPFRRAAETVGTRLDRAALRDATEQSDQVTLFGCATRNEGVDYDWTALPPFVGVDVWSPRSDRLLSPDTATTVFERLGLPTLPAVEKELRAAHAGFDGYGTAAGFPPSGWRDGPAAAVLIRDKTGNRASLEHPDRDPLPDPVTQPPAELAAEHATDDRVERTVAELTAAGQSSTADAVCTRLVADLARERYAHLRGTAGHTTTTQAFQSAVAARVQAYLGR